MINIETLYELFSDDSECLKFERVHPQLSLRTDLHAFLLLDRLIPGSTDIISGADHDKIYLDADLEKLAKVITKEQVIELIRCGIFVEDDLLCMFV